MGAGRPTDYTPDYCALVVELGRQGKSVVQMACAIGVHKDTLYEWAKVHKGFSDAFAYARQCSQCWWEDKGQGGLDLGSGFSANLWSRSMAARFPADYTVKQKNEVTGPNGSSLGPAVIVIPPDMSPSEAAKAYQDIIDRT